MERSAFDTIAAEEYVAIPAKWRVQMSNVALLIEDDSPAGDLGLYQGVPLAARGSTYGEVLPDTITLYYQPLLEEAEYLLEEGRAEDYPAAVRLAIKETIWHELGHHLGLDDAAIHEREHAGTNDFDMKKKEPSQGWFGWMGGWGRKSGGEGGEGVA